MSTRDAYVEKFKAELDEWNAEIERLEAKSKQAKADAGIRYEQELADLRQKRDEAQRKVREIERNTSGAWEDIKEGADEAWRAAKDAISRAASRFE